MRFFSGAWGEYEWECVELAMRFMYQVYGVHPYSANGVDVVNNYASGDGGGLTKVSNGTVGQAPTAGDVISFSSPTNSAGHVAVVASSSVDGNGNGSITLISQNDSSNGWRTLSVSGWRVAGFGSETPYGWLHDPQNRAGGGGGGGVTEGGFVRVSDGPSAGLISRVVGGALLGLETCDPLGGCPNPTSMTMTQYQAYQAAHPLIADNTYVRVANGPYAGLVARAAGGALLGLETCDPLGGCPNPVNVTQVAFEGYRNAHQLIADNTYVRVANGPYAGLVARAAGGALLGLETCDPLGGCPNPVNVTQVAFEGYRNAHQLIADNTYVRVANGPSAGLVARAAGGALLGLETCDPLGGCPNPVNVTQVAFDGYRNAHQLIADNTYVRVANGPYAGLVARAAGGALLGLDTCEPLGGCPNPVNVTQVAFEGYRNAHARPVDGTKVHTLPSNVYYVFDGGLCSAISGPTAAIDVDDVSADCSSPTVSASQPTVAFTRATSVLVSWSGSDAGSGVASYRVRYTRAPYNGAMSSPYYPAAWQNITTTSLTHTGLAQGYDYCYSVSATDKAGNASAWSPKRCVAVGQDDRALTASSGWTRATGSSWWNGTTTTSKTLNATLTRAGVELDRVGIVATRCASCGIVGVYVGATLIGKINLYAASTAYQQMLTLPTFTLRTGTVTVKVLTSGKTVQIDGLLTSQT